jgi:hypothetical protein
MLAASSEKAYSAGGFGEEFAMTPPAHKRQMDTGWQARWS